MGEVSKNWLFTIFDEAWVPEYEKYKYLIMQKEVCPTTGRIHWQGFCQFTTAHRRRGVQRTLKKDDAHVQPVKDNEAQRHYCSKPHDGCNCTHCEKARQGIPPVSKVEHGVFAPSQGCRTDIKSVIGVPIRTVMKEKPETFIKYHRSLIAFRDWEDKVPSGRWEIHRGIPAPEGAYEIRWTYQDTPAGRIRQLDYTAYDYETEGVLRVNRLDVEYVTADYEPYVKSIYRGTIVNKIRNLYILPLL